MSSEVLAMVVLTHFLAPFGKCVLPHTKIAIYRIDKQLFINFALQRGRYSQNCLTQTAQKI